MAQVLELSESLKKLIVRILNEKLRGKVGKLSDLTTEFSDEQEKLDNELIELIVKGINERT